MNITQTASGVLVASEKAQKPEKPREHGSRVEIRWVLAMLDEHLGQYEQTTHGSLFINGITIEGVAKNLATAYENPTAFNISELSQCISALLRQEASA